MNSHEDISYWTTTMYRYFDLTFELIAGTVRMDQNGGTWGSGSDPRPEDWFSSMYVCGVTSL